MVVSQIDLYNILKKKLGEKEAESLTTYVKSEVQEKINDLKDYFASKADLANTKVDIIKWMFIFWIGQLAAVFMFLKFVM